MVAKMKYHKRLKRVLDVLFSLSGLLLLFPILVIVSLAIKIESKGPIIFKQERLGIDGKVFKIYKFRSMKVDAEKDSVGLFNYSEDPRVTRVGKFIRKTSIDELPQLLNVLIGDMSLVGPRPAVTYELGDFDTLNKRYKKRFMVLPGITGLAQVSGRNELPWDQKVDYDNMYIDLFKVSGVFLDVKIIFKTMINVFKSKDIFEEKLNSELTDEESARLAEAEIIKKAHEPD